MNTRILCAYDGSAAAEKAFDYAVALSKAFGGELKVVSVAQPPEPPEDVETEAILESAKEHFEKGFEALARKAEAAQARASFEVAVGHPAEQILYQAEAFGADHIVIGHRGKSFVERWLVGSVSKRVVAYAGCNVTVVR